MWDSSDDEVDSVQQQTLRQLVNAKEEARNAVRTAQAECEEKHGQDENDMFRAWVNGEIRAFLRELRAIRQNFNEDGLEEDYWDGFPIGTCELPDGRAVTFSGIDDVVALEHPIQIEVEQSSPGYGGGTETVSQKYYLPTRIYVEAYYAGVSWMADVGLLPEKGIAVGPEANPVDSAGRFNG
ncbi:hypothetical protein [Halosimplex carlsbadense]|uniref:hypothetical protein n=1 Tax=Halosimplex carlsbadense TaxID=171164 RepID=UPI0012685026|nr:hypothetical protein [Halosimplex carlsbadense]